MGLVWGAQGTGAGQGANLRGTEDTGSNTLARELGKIGRLIDAVRGVDRGVGMVRVGSVQE